MKEKERETEMAIVCVCVLWQFWKIVSIPHDILKNYVLKTFCCLLEYLLAFQCKFYRFLFLSSSCLLACYFTGSIKEFPFEVIMCLNYSPLDFCFPSSSTAATTTTTS